MPFKDIDLDELITQKRIENEVLKQVTINNKLNTSTLDGYRDKLNAIELVTGEKYDFPSFSDRVKQEEDLGPLNMQLDEIRNQLTASHQPQQQQIVYRNPNAEFLRNTYRTVIGDDISLDNETNVTAAIQRVGDIKRGVRNKESQVYKDLFTLSEYLKGYRTANFSAPPRRRLPSVPPTIQIEEFQDQEGEGLFSNINEVVEKLKVLIGEMSSGNENIKLKNEANDILEYLLRAKQINKQQYLKTMDIIYNL